MDKFMWEEQDNMEITLACSPKVNTYMSDRIKVAEYHAIYINFRKLVKAQKKKKKKSIISRLTLSPYYLRNTTL